VIKQPNNGTLYIRVVILLKRFNKSVHDEKLQLRQNWRHCPLKTSTCVIRDLKARVIIPTAYWIDATENENSALRQFSSGSYMLTDSPDAYNNPNYVEVVKVDHSARVLERLCERRAARIEERLKTLESVKCYDE
jgi:hypothetical protein